MILAIDPGTTESAYVILDENLKPIDFGKIDNDKLRGKIRWGNFELSAVAIEMIASYGKAVGQEVFDTCVWIGRFAETVEKYREIEPALIYRRSVKINLCNSTSAKDSNVIQALIDRFAYGQSNRGKGTKKSPGWFHGFSKDVWQAYAVGITYCDSHIREEI